jgi:hypothetical protein
MSEFEFEKWFAASIYAANLELQQLRLNPDLSLWYVLLKNEDDSFLFDCFATDYAHAVEQAQNSYPDVSVLSARKAKGQAEWQDALAKVNLRLRKLNTAIPVDDLQDAKQLFKKIIAVYEGKATA